MVYEEIPVLSRSEIERDLESDDREKKTIALLSGALHSNESEWIDMNCLRFLRESDRSLRYAAIVSLGHIVRLHGNLNLPVLMPLLDTVGRDSKLAGDVALLRSEIKTHMTDSTR